MALVPDEVISRFADLKSPKAALIFVYYCRKRDNKTGLAWPSLSTIARELKIPKTTICTLRKKLIEKGWLELISGDTVRVVMGFEPFELSERHSDNSNDARPVRSRNSNANSNNSNKSFEKLESHIRNNHPIEPAQLTSLEEKENAREDDGAKAGEIFEEIFRHPVTIYQQEQLGVITDHPVWRKTLRDWKLNNYSPRSISGMLESYQANLLKSSQAEGRNKNATSGTYVGSNKQSTKADQPEAKTDRIARLLKLADDGGEMGYDDAMFLLPIAPEHPEVHEAAEVIAEFYSVGSQQSVEVAA